MNELITIESLESNQDSAMLVFQQKNGLDPLIDHVRKQVAGFVADVTNDKGRKECASMAHKVAKSRIAIEKIGLEVATRLKQIPKLVDAERKRVKDELQSLQDSIRAPLTDWENLEDERKNALKLIIADLQSCVVIIKDFTDIDKIQNEICKIEAKCLDMQEYQDEFDHVKMQTLDTLNAHLEATKKQLETQKELDALKAEKAARDEIDRINQIKAQAEQEAKAKAEQAAQAVILQAKMAEEQAKQALERAKIEAEQAVQAAILKDKIAAEAILEASKKAEIEKAAAVQAEIEKAAAAQFQKDQIAAAEKAANLAKQRNIDHQKEINNQALQSLTKFGLSEIQSKDLIKAIKLGQIQNITINY